MENKEISKERIEENNRIINQMLMQLGGGRFFALTGSKPKYKDCKAENPMICIGLVKNSSKANYLKIYYMSGVDLYRMEFVRATTKALETVSEFDNIYWDQLQDVFTSVTGLYTRF